MTDPITSALNILTATRATPATGLSEDQRQALSLVLPALLLQQARSIMRGKGAGLNLCEPEDLASAGMEKLVLVSRPAILRFEGRSEGQLVSFIQRLLTNMLIDDQRRLYGRARTQPDTVNPVDGAQDEAEPENDEELQARPEVDDYVPRSFVDIVDDQGNEFLKSQKRSATGYLLLKQTRQHLHEYLDQLPGSVVLVTIGKRSKTPRTKKVKLTESHAKLLRLWLSGEGEQRWNEIAAEMKRPVGTVKRWWAEVVLAFEQDPSATAKALRGLYRVAPTHTRKAQDIVEKDEKQQKPSGEEPGEATPA